MLVLRNSLLVVVIVVAVLVRRSTCGKKQFHPLIKNFHIYGCITNKTITKPYIKVKQFEYRNGLYIALSGSSLDITTLQSESSSPCRIPTDILLFTSSTTDQETITITFHQVLENNTKPFGRLENTSGSLLGENKFFIGNYTGYGLDDVTGIELDESMEIKQDNMGGKMMEEYQCNASKTDKFKLRSAYGFIMCPDDPANIKKVWKEWQEQILEAKRFSALKNKIIIVATCGPGSVVILFILCALCRLRSSSSRASLKRRPSTTSGIRTGSTHDHIPIRT